MSLDKAIQHGKEKRKPYRGSKAVDPNCRNHGNCPWCQKKIKYKKNRKRANDTIDLRTYLKGGENGT